MARKKSKINDMEQVHAVDESRPTTLDEIWGVNQFSKYSVTKAEDYEEQLNDMNLTDLQREAYGVGLIPIHDRSQLTTRLIREFKKNTLGKIPASEDKTFHPNPHSKKAKEIKRILQA